MRRRRDCHEHDGSLECLRHSVRHTCGGQEEVSRPCFEYLVSDGEPRLSRDDEIEFVGPVMRVNRLLLTRLEAIEPYEQVAGAEAVELGQIGRASCRERV